MVDNATTAIKAGADDARTHWLDEGRTPGGFLRQVDFEANSRGVTDFPHPTSLYPAVQDKPVDALGSYDYGTRKRILESNAAELQNLRF